MTKKIFNFTTMLMCLITIMLCLVGCGLFNNENEHENENDFNPPYLENYYVNKHNPICITGGMDVYKYDENAKDLWMGGNAYHGGFVFWPHQTGDENAQVDLPLNGLYENISFVIGGDWGEITKKVDENGNVIYPNSSSQYSSSPPTLIGQAKEIKVGIQFWADDKMVDEILFSNYQVPVRYTYNISGAQKFTIKTVAGARDLAGSGSIPVLELTVWEGEPQETGYVPSQAGDEPIQLIKDLKPYLIPSTSSVVYYPNATPSSEGRNYINMNGIKYENVIATYVTMGLIENDDEEIFFNLEGKYNFLTFTAGVADRNTTYSEGTAWLTVKADGVTIYEELYSSHELQKKITLDISGCNQLVFAWMSDDGNIEYGNSTGNYFGIGDLYVAKTEEVLNTLKYSSRDLPNRPVKMISELGTFGVFSNMDDDAVLDGSTQFKTFSMGGIKYNEGIMLYSANSLLQTIPACASFNLDGKYDTISFVAGHISNSDVYKNDTIEIYADGILIKTIEVDCKMLPQEYVVEVNNCRHLEFVSGKLTNNSMYRPALGIANLIAYPEGYVDTDFFPKRNPADYGPSCDLIEKFGFYDVHSGGRMDSDIGGVDVEDGYYDGSSQKNYFTIGDRKIYSGILLRTSVHLSFDTEGADAMIGFSLAGFTVLALAAAGEAHESAFALANIKDSGYTSVTFTVAMQKERTATGGDDTTILRIGANNESVKEITLSKDMIPTTYTVELGENCDRLLFFLECTLEDDASHTYAIYDITLNK